MLLELLSRLLRPDDENEIVGDLEENYALRRERHGPLNAQWWLLRQVASLPIWLLRERSETRGTPSSSARNPIGDSFMRSRSQEFRLALRSFTRAPGFSFITIITLSLGVAANTAIFSVVDGVLLESLPYEDSDRLVYIWHTAPGMGVDRIGTATGLQTIYASVPTELENLATYRTGSANITGLGDPIRAQAVDASASLFEVLGVQPALGRAYTAEEDLPGAPPVVVISHGLWSSHFASDPNVLGRTIELNGVTHDIIGVMPASFGFPSSGVQIFTPMKIDPQSPDFGGFNVEGVGRLTGAGTAEGLQSELTRLLPRVTERFSEMTTGMMESTQLAPRVTSLKEMIVGPVASALWVVMGTVGLVLLIACANVGNLFLARAESRQKEVAIRTAMGAGRRDLFWQYAMESAILGVSSGLLAIVLAAVGLKLLVAIAPEELPRISEVGLDGSVLAFTATISLAAAFLFGALPMLRHTLGQPATALRDGSRGSTAGKSRNRGRQLLVASQVAFAMVLLVGSGLMLRSFARLLDVDIGFNATDVTTFRVTLPTQAYPGVEAVARFHTAALERIQAIPGVIGAAAVSILPLAGADWSGDPLNQEEKPVGPDELPPIIALKAVTPSYFATMGIPLLSGRVIEQSDIDDRVGSVVINQALADRFWPGEDPLDRRIKHSMPGEGEWSTVVGVVGNTPLGTLTEEQREVVYYSTAPREGSGTTWVSRTMVYTVRSGLPTSALLDQVRAVLREQDPNLPISQSQLLTRHVEAARVEMAFTMILLSIAAGVGLLLGAIGIYGVISYLTAMRTREIGVRMALGAQAASVRGMVMRQGATVALLGVAVGLVGALVLTRFLGTLLFEVSATDPLTFAGVSVLLFCVSMLATYLPARRAAATAPLEALRDG